MLSKSQLKYIQSLGHKKFRDQENVFIAEGPKIIRELITEVPGDIVAIYALDKWINDNKHLTGAIKSVTINETELERISQLPAPNQAIAVVKKPQPRKIIASGKITLALDTVQDPGNMGTIIRIADWFGVEQIVASHECADMYNPKVVQSTMGSIARIVVYYTDLPSWLKEQKVKIYAAALDGRDVGKLDKLSEAIIIIGNESKGIDPDIMQLAGERITIPKKGKAESLNAAVAAGIILSRII